MRRSVLLLAGLAAFALSAPPASQAAPKADYSVPKTDPVPAGTPDFTGKWMMVNPARTLKPDNAKAAPLNAKGLAVYAKRQAALKAGDKKADPLSDCVMHGEPRLLFSPYPMLIMQYGKHVDFVHQANHTFRITYFNDTAPDDPDPHWLGWSSAHWAGKTLVIDSGVFNDQTWLDYSGLPHGTQLAVQERYRLQGGAIHGQVTITDPEFYTAPWTASFTLKKLPGQMVLPESVCTREHKM